MATDFRSVATGQLAFVRWCSGDGVRYELGTVSNLEQLLAQLRAGDSFEPMGMRMTSDPQTVEQLEQGVASGAVTFGEYCFTVEAGSGELFRLTVEH